MCLCQTPGRRRPIITGRLVNTGVRGPISIRAAVVRVPLFLFAGWRQHTGCVPRLVAVETGQHLLPMPGLGSEGANLLYIANEIVVATLFMSWSRVGYFDACLCCYVLAADRSFSFSPAIYHSNSSNIKRKRFFDLRAIPPTISRSGDGEKGPAVLPRISVTTTL